MRYIYGRQTWAGGACTIGDGVVIKQSTIQNAGNGLFASKVFARNSCVTEYGGQVVSAKSLDDVRWAAGLGHGMAVDGKNVSTADGNAAGSFANHSSTPNATLVRSHNPVLVGVDRGIPWGERVWVQATQVINPDDEILVNYGKTYLSRHCSIMSGS